MAFSDFRTAFFLTSNVGFHPGLFRTRAGCALRTLLQWQHQVLYESEANINQFIESI